MTSDEWLLQAAKELWQAQGREDMNPEDWPEEVGLILRALRQAYDRGRVDGRNAAPDRMIARFFGEEPSC